MYSVPMKSIGDIRQRVREGNSASFSRIFPAAKACLLGGSAGLILLIGVSYYTPLQQFRAPGFENAVDADDLEFDDFLLRSNFLRKGKALPSNYRPIHVLYYDAVHLLSIQMFLEQFPVYTMVGSTIGLMVFILKRKKKLLTE